MLIVQCDRTKPCTACCARGHPSECEFLVPEGNDYGPIPQSYELRKLRAENQRLKERLQARRIDQSDPDDDDEGSPERRGSRKASKPSSTRQKRFRTGDRTDNLYFGTPGLASVVADVSRPSYQVEMDPALTARQFANLQIGSQSLTHTVPRGREMYAADEGSMYPFTVLPNYTSSAKLVELLPDRDRLFRYVELFQHHAQSCSFPHAGGEIDKKEVERFLSNRAQNAENSPDMLAFLFMVLAVGMQMGDYYQNGEQWVEGAVEASRRQSDVFRECILVRLSAHY